MEDHFLKKFHREWVIHASYTEARITYSNNMIFQKTQRQFHSYWWMKIWDQPQIWGWIISHQNFLWILKKIISIIHSRPSLMSFLHIIDSERRFFCDHFTKTNTRYWCLAQFVFIYFHKMNLFISFRRVVICTIKCVDAGSLEMATLVLFVYILVIITWELCRYSKTYKVVSWVLVYLSVK